VAADAAAGHARSPWDALYFTRWPDGLAPYAYGSRFWEYLSQTIPSGDSVPPRFTEATAGQLIPFRVGRPLRHVGVPDALTEQWSRAVATAGRAEPADEQPLIEVACAAEPLARVSPDGRNPGLHLTTTAAARSACAWSTLATSRCCAHIAPRGR